MVQLLLEHHPDIGIQDTEGMTALDTAVEEGFPEIVKFLLEDMVSLQHLQKEICVLGMASNSILFLSVIHLKTYRIARISPLLPNISNANATYVNSCPSAASSEE